VSNGKELPTFRTRVVRLEGKAFQEISDCLQTMLFSDMAVTNVISRHRVNIPGD